MVHCLQILPLGTKVKHCQMLPWEFGDDVNERFAALFTSRSKVNAVMASHKARAETRLPLPVDS